MGRNIQYLQDRGSTKVNKESTSVISLSKHDYIIQLHSRSHIADTNNCIISTKVLSLTFKFKALKTKILVIY